MNLNPVVVGYTRISTRDQSNFSLEAQCESINRYCSQNGYDVKEIFTDDGQSAKDFNRLNWKRLEAFLKKTYREIDYLVVMKYDRFSRNLMDSLSMIQQIEVKWNIKIISVMEPIGIPPESPFFFQLRTQLLLNAHVERLIIRDRTMIGMRQAAEGGRYLGTAPYGYKNERDERNKPVLVVDEFHADIVRDIFTLYLKGVSYAEIQRIATKKGMPIRGHDIIYRILVRPAYAGYVHVPATDREKGYLIKGLHKAIVDEEMFWAVQEKITRKKETKRISYNENVPFKGVLKCHCGNTFTSSRSKGKTKYYWYYECPAGNGAHRKSFNADKIHYQFDLILKECSIGFREMEYIRAKVAENIEKTMEHNSSAIKELKIKQLAAEKKVGNLEEKFINNAISNAVYKKWNLAYRNELKEIKKKLESLDASWIEKVWKQYNQEMNKVLDLSELYQSATVLQKNSFIKLGFGNTLSYENGIYRTQFLHPLFVSKVLILKEKRLLEYKQPLDKIGKIPDSSPVGYLAEHMKAIFDWARSIKTA